MSHELPLNAGRPGSGALDIELREFMDMINDMVVTMVPVYAAASPVAQASFRARLSRLAADFEADAAGECTGCPVVSG